MVKDTCFDPGVGENLTTTLFMTGFGHDTISTSHCPDSRLCKTEYYQQGVRLLQRSPLTLKSVSTFYRKGLYERERISCVVEGTSYLLALDWADGCLAGEDCNASKDWH